MNIWAWVYPAMSELREAGQHRLADIVSRLPSAVCASRHDEAEALCAEGVILARAVGHRWIELFLRHWRAQSRLAYRSDVSGGMTEVLDLLDLAHQPDTAGCPQAMCVRQDVCIAYSVMDGPGYGEERLAASGEGLASINPHWGCFGCLSSEYASALMDLGRHEEAIRFCREQSAASKREHQGALEFVDLQKAEALIALGRFGQAWRMVQKPDKRLDSNRRQVRYQLLRVLALCGLERADEAWPIWESLTGIDEIEYELAARAALSLARAGKAFDEGLWSLFDARRESLLASGSLAFPAKIALCMAEIAALLDQPERAAQQLAALARIRPLLRHADWADRERSALLSRYPSLAA